MLVEIDAGGRPTPQLRRARLATGTLFFANGCGLGSWPPHIPDVKIWHALSDGVLGLALLAIAGSAVASLPVAGALTAATAAAPPPGLQRCCSARSCRCRCWPRTSPCCSRRSSCSGSASARWMCP